MDCTRLENSRKLVSRKDPNEVTSVKRQIVNISQTLKLQGKLNVVLIDDVVFSGNVLKEIIKSFYENGIRVVGRRSAI